MDDIISDSTKIRKRGCSPSSSTSSMIQNYRFKKAVLVGKRGGGSSTTPVPSWRMVASRSPSIGFRVAAASDSPRYTPPPPTGISGKSRPPQLPVSARKLAATLWELNEVPSPAMSERRLRRDHRGRSSVHSGSLPPHLTDPSHSPPDSERMERSGTKGPRRRESPTSRKLKITEEDVAALDSASNASSMETESKSRSHAPANSTHGAARTRLKDVSGALTTSKELLKIISRMWGQENHPSSSMSLISALHTELERARLQINQLIQEQRSDQNEINYLMKRFAEEKAAWKNKEKQAVEAAVESVMGELEVERKLRRRFESLNKKIGTELTDTKASLFKVLKELEGERRAREVVEQMCDELSRSIGEEKVEAEEMKRESVRMREEVEKEREMLHIANALREERAQMKLSEARHQFEEKNAAVDNLRGELEAVFRNERHSSNKGKKGHDPRQDRDLAAAISLTNRANIGFVQEESREEDGAEVEGNYDIALDSGEDSAADSDLHSIELNITESNSKRNSMAPPHRASPMVSLFRKKLPANEDIKPRKSAYNKEEPRRSTSYLQRSVSDMIDWEGSDVEHEKHARRSCQDELQRYKLLKSLRDRVLFSSKHRSEMGIASPSRQSGHSLPSRDSSNFLLEKPMTMEGGSKVAGKTRRNQS